MMDTHVLTLYKFDRPTPCVFHARDYYGKLQQMLWEYKGLEDVENYTWKYRLYRAVRNHKENQPWPPLPKGVKVPNFKPAPRWRPMTRQEYELNRRYDFCARKGWDPRYVSGRAPRKRDNNINKIRRMR